VRADRGTADRAQRERANLERPRYLRRQKRQDARTASARALAVLREMWRPPSGREKADTGA